MNKLVALSLIGIAGAAYGQAPQTTNRASNPSAQIQQPAKLSLLGKNMQGTPRPLGIKGVQKIKKAGMKSPALLPTDSNFATVIAQATSSVEATLKKRKNTANTTALVLFDANGTYGWIGNIYGHQISNLLTHFGLTVTRHGVESYSAGEMNNYGSTYYVGTTYYNKLPAAFTSDFMADTQPFCWMGYNLWEVAWNSTGSAWNSAFTSKFGFQFAYLDGTGYPTVNYKSSTLTKQQSDPVQGDVMITNSSVASVLATSTNGTTSEPYITKGANLWYIADNPLEYVSYNRGDDRYLAFADILNDTTGIVEPTTKRAVLRIEDVSAICDSASLRGIADTLYSFKIPYVVCVIPDYKDPLGVFNNGVPLEIQMQNSPQFISDLQYMQKEGAQLIMHGVSHQYDNVPNPVNGVSAADVEFFRVETDANGNQEVVGPVSEDSTAWVTARIQTGFTMFSQAGFAKPTGWNTPHYYASPVDYQLFGSAFKYAMDRVLVFASDVSGDVDYLVQYAPYVINDEYGNHRIPETCGYCDPNGTSGMVNLPANMVGYAQQIECVRGGWAGMYYHWFLGTTMLQELVSGIQALGYTYVDPSKNTN